MQTFNTYYKESARDSIHLRISNSIEVEREEFNVDGAHITGKQMLYKLDPLIQELTKPPFNYNRFGISYKINRQKAGLPSEPQIVLERNVNPRDNTYSSVEIDPDLTFIYINIPIISELSTINLHRTIALSDTSLRGKEAIYESIKHHFMNPEIGYKGSATMKGIYKKKEFVNNQTYIQVPDVYIFQDWDEPDQQLNQELVNDIVNDLTKVAEIFLRTNEVYIKTPGDNFDKSLAVLKQVLDISRQEEIQFRDKFGKIDTMDDLNASDLVGLI